MLWRDIHAIFEASGTIRIRDIQRAREQAAILEAATGEETIAVVVGEAINPADRERADRMGVRVLLPAKSRQDPTSDGRALRP